jgi:negative regulator of sigma E activity
MNRDLELKLQAYVDGELPEREAHSLARWIAGDQEAQALLAELKMAKAFLQGNEPELSVPASREFYWSKIQRAIERADAVEATPAPGWWLGWQKYLAPLAGVALVVFFAIGAFNIYNARMRNNDGHHLAEIENLSDEMGAFSFRASENMFVVWVYDKATDESPEPELIDDLIIQ